jgi:hypothetical protein
MPPAPPGASASAEYVTMTQLAAVPPTLKSIDVSGTLRKLVDFVVSSVSAVLKSIFSILAQLPVARVPDRSAATAEIVNPDRNSSAPLNRADFAVMVISALNNAVLIFAVDRDPLRSHQAQTFSSCPDRSRRYRWMP